MIDLRIFLNDILKMLRVILYEIRSLYSCRFEEMLKYMLSLERCLRIGRLIMKNNLRFKSDLYLMFKLLLML